MQIPKQVSDAGLEAVRTYRAALPYGEKWAVMCALQMPPGTKGTDRAFNENRLCQQQFDDMPKLMAQRMLREAKAAGINTSGKQYMGGLADKRAHRDPEAWVDSTADIVRVARKRNLTVEGIVSHQGTPVPPQRKVLSERIIREEMRYYRKLHPKMKAAEMREMIVAKHGHQMKRRGK